MPLGSYKPKQLKELPKRWFILKTILKEINRKWPVVDWEEDLDKTRLHVRFQISENKFTTLTFTSSEQHQISLSIMSKLLLYQKYEQDQKWDKDTPPFKKLLNFLNLKQSSPEHKS